MLHSEYVQRRVLPAHLRPRKPEVSSAVTIRSATRRDLPAVQRIYAHYVVNSTVTLDTEPKSLAAWRRVLEQQDRLGLPFVVAESGSRTIVGFATAQPWKPKAGVRVVEDALYLAPAATGKGTGRALLAALIERASAAGSREMIAMIADEKADASVRLHESQGFTESGRMGRVGFKFNRWLGVIMLSRPLRKRR